MTSNLNMKSRSIINVKQAQAHESTHAHVNFVSTTINSNNTLMTTNYQKYVNNRLICLLVVRICKTHFHIS